ncbi:MAG TPA: Uma2 family endonuclease [Pirellulales bacterium]|nr:Uma2 family endonuclease [Pirellulales bacterium]
MSSTVPLTLERYEQLIEAYAFHPRSTARVELIYGQMLATGCVELEVENAICCLYNRWLRTLSLPTNVWIQVKSPVAMPDQQSMPEPNMTWIAKQDGPIRRPVASDVFLLIEVALGSLSFDRGEKADLYAAAGIKDYWIVNLVDQCVEVRREPRDGRYQSVESFAAGAEVRPLAFPELALPVALLFPGQ